MKMSTIKRFIGGAAFFAALGIVGSIEHGAALGLAWWLFPLLGVSWLCFKDETSTNKQEG